MIHPWCAPIRDRREASVRQQGLHDPDPGPARGRGQDAAGRSARPGEGAGISGPLPLDAERYRVLGQSRHPALRDPGLLAPGERIVERVTIKGDKPF
ncbi:hypothetical protein ACRAWD_05860 [Caulobacter segnis]